MTLTLSDQVGSIQKWQSSQSSDFSNPTDLTNKTTILTAENLSQTTYYRAIVQSGVCASANSASGIVTVNPLSTASIQGNGGAVCSGASASFTVSGTSGATLTYTITGQSTPQTLALTGSNQTVTAPNATADVTLTLVSVALNGCPANLTGTSTVTVKPLPTLSTSGNTSVVYGYGSNCTTLTATASSGPASLTWSTGATGGSIQVCPTATTSYTVTASGANGCTVRRDIIVSVNDVRCGAGGVKMCYQGREVCVAPYLVPTYQRYGATLGACGTASTRIGVQESAELPFQLSLKAYPNPAQDAVTVEVLSPTTGPATLDVVDMTGRTRQSRRESLVEGRNEVELRLGTLPTGLYLIRLRDAAGRQATVRVSKE